MILLIIKSLILGIVEGITEFLPVSSTGHLIIFEKLLNFTDTNQKFIDMYTYVIQLGAILAIVILYWGKIKDTITNFFPQKDEFETSGLNFWFKIFVACIPGGIFGILLNDLADKYLFKPLIVAITLFFGGIWMIYAENKFRKNKNSIKNKQVTMKQAVIVGLFQCLAIIPGMSRSASTIIGGWVSGLSTVAATEFSFFLAIPVMVGMSLLKIIKLGGLTILTTSELAALAVGFIVSFIVALIVVDKFIAFLKKKRMRIFAVYRMLFAVIVLIAGFAGLFS